MRARLSGRGAALLLVLAVVLAVVAGCGGTSSAGTSRTAVATASGPSADQIVKSSQAKMATVNSAAFTADFTLQLKGDTGKMTDPTAKALLSQGVSFSAEGKSARKPAATDMTVSLAFAGQNLAFGVRSVGKKAWLQYQGAWYTVDAKSARALDKQAESGATPTDQLKSLGIDPSTWGANYRLVGTESLGGVQVYHVTATADPQQLARSLARAAESPKLRQELGGAGSQFGLGSTQSTQQTEKLAKSLKSAAVDYWIGVADDYLYKAQFVAGMDTSGLQGMQGVGGMTLKGVVTMGDFGRAFSVTRPAGAKPFQEFMNQLFGGMLGGSAGLSL
jgi:hypothetical protein